MIEIIKAETSADYATIEKLAVDIWHDHYDPIIGSAQVNYMLGKFQSIKAMTEQVSEGYDYYMCLDEKKIIGYCAFRRRDDHVFISKLYVHKSARGRGAGKQQMGFVIEIARKYNLSAIRLTVNKSNNDSIAIYKQMGFVELDQLVIDIGHGYVMDDYLMVLEI